MQLAAGEGEKVRGEIAQHTEFVTKIEQIIEVSKAICEARPAVGEAVGGDPPGREGKSLREGSFAADRDAEMGRPAVEAPGRWTARPTWRRVRQSCGSACRCSAVVCSGRRCLPIPAIAASAGCGRGHEAVFTGYREQIIDTALGMVTCSGAWYHCARCGRGLAPRDAELEWLDGRCRRG